MESCGYSIYPFFFKKSAYITGIAYQSWSLWENWVFMPVLHLEMVYVTLSCPYSIYTDFFKKT